MDDKREAWAVYTNTDLTEGRGYSVILYVCDIRETAERLAFGAGVMGSKADVVKVELVKVGGTWYGPVNIKRPTSEDMRRREWSNERRAVLTKARELGLSDEEIALIRKGEL